MEIRRLSRPVYEDEHVALQQELDSVIADAWQLMTNATEDPRLRFTARKKIKHIYPICSRGSVKRSVGL